jgi:hypothetical protein
MLLFLMGVSMLLFLVGVSIISLVPQGVPRQVVRCGNVELIALPRPYNRAGAAPLGALHSSLRPPPRVPLR